MPRFMNYPTMKDWHLRLCLTSWRNSWEWLGQSLWNSAETPIKWVASSQVTAKSNSSANCNQCESYADHCLQLGRCYHKAYSSSKTYCYCGVLLYIFLQDNLHAALRTKDNTSWITHPSFCKTLQGHMQEELWLICWITGAAKCFTTPLILQI